MIVIDQETPRWIRELERFIHVKSLLLVHGNILDLVSFPVSEYAAAHADQKLLGSPPGYVGYEQGGQLTNAIKENPFSVLLFDEIEKAHPRIFDKLLQILDVHAIHIYQPYNTDRLAGWRKISLGDHNVFSIINRDVIANGVREFGHIIFN